MIKVKDEYRNHREYWKSKEYLKTIFGKDVDVKSARVKKLLDVIDRIPESPVYTIAAYGSLLNTGDIFRTMPTAHNFRRGSICGFTRVFNVGHLDTGCVLNIRPSSDKEEEVICNFIDIEFEDLPHYIIREGWYDVKVLDHEYDYEIDELIDNPVLTVVGKDFVVNSSIGVEPQLNYLHLCVSGMKDVAGWEGVQHFMNETLCYSNEENNYIPVRQWLADLDLGRYLITKEFSSR